MNKEEKNLAERMALADSIVLREDHLRMIPLSGASLVDIAIIWKVGLAKAHQFLKKMGARHSTIRGETLWFQP